MIQLSVAMAFDRRSIGVASSKSNISELPLWLIQYDTLELGDWNCTINSSTGAVDLHGIGHPVEVHHEFDSPSIVSSIRVYRSVGAHELYVQITPLRLPG